MRNGGEDCARGADLIISSLLFSYLLCKGAHTPGFAHSASLKGGRFPMLCGTRRDLDQFLLFFSLVRATYIP